MSKSQVPVVRAPLLGEHSREVLEHDLGMPEEEIRTLLEAGVLVETEIKPAGSPS